MVSGSQFIPNTFTGQIRPVRKWRRSIPKLYKTLTVGGDPTNPAKPNSTVKIWVYGASYEYPKVTINFGINNGAGSSFSSISHEDFTNLVQFFGECLQEVETILPALEREKEVVLQAQEQYDKTVQQIQQLQQLANMQQEEQIEDVPEIPETTDQSQNTISPVRKYSRRPRAV